VARSETLPHEGVPVLEVPATHTFLMDHPAVRRIVAQALRDAVDGRGETR